MSKEAMQRIIAELSTALGRIANAQQIYLENLSERKFTKPETKELAEAYESTISVWYKMKKREKREP